MRVLITGASGFIGTNLSSYLASRGHAVYRMVRHASAQRISYGVGEVVLGATEDSEGNDKTLLAIAPDVVCHLAMYGGNSGQTNVPEMFKTNVSGTRSMIDSSIGRGVKLFINFGSSSEYGTHNDRVDEGQLPQPHTMYGYTKLVGTMYASYMARTQDWMKITTLRIFSAFGPLERDCRFVPQVLKAAMSGTLPPLSNPLTARDFIYVDDVCSVVAMIIEGARSPQELYNVGTGIQTSLSTAVDHIKRYTGCNENPQWGTNPPRDLDPFFWRANPTRLIYDYGWKPRSFLNGVVNFAGWIREHPGVTFD